MPISFPPAPTVDAEYTLDGRTWVFNGVGWVPKPEGVATETPYTPPSADNVQLRFSNFR